jgi:hypothetical protein
MNLLDWVLFIPLIAFLAILILPKDISKFVALGVGLGVFVLFALFARAIHRRKPRDRLPIFDQHGVDYDSQHPLPHRS